MGATTEDIEANDPSTPPPERRRVIAACYLHNIDGSLPLYFAQSPLIQGFSKQHKMVLPIYHCSSNTVPLLKARPGDHQFALLDTAFLSPFA